MSYPATGLPDQVSPRTQQLEMWLVYGMFVLRANQCWQLFSYLAERAGPRNDHH